MSYLKYQQSKNYWYACSNIVTIFTLLLLLFASIGYRLEIFSFVFSLLTLTKYAIYASFIALVISFIAFGTLLSKHQVLSSSNIIINIVVNTTIIIFFYNSILALKSNPVINDISTNYDDLIEFKVNKKNKLLIDKHILLQKYGGFKQPNYTIVPLLINNKTLVEIFDESQIILNNMGLEIIYSNQEEGLIEAVHSSFWYGFKDDIIIRIEKLISDEIKIDVRSASRTGISDFGVNSLRIKDFLEKLSSNLKN